jgi:hypothetical protein
MPLINLSRSDSQTEINRKMGFEPIEREVSSGIHKGTGAGASGCGTRWPFSNSSQKCMPLRNPDRIYRYRNVKLRDLKTGLDLPSIPQSSADMRALLVNCLNWDPNHFVASEWELPRKRSGIGQTDTTGYM